MVCIVLYLLDIFGTCDTQHSATGVSLCVSYKKSFWAGISNVGRSWSLETRLVSLFQPIFLFCCRVAAPPVQRRAGNRGFVAKVLFYIFSVVAFLLCFIIENFIL